MTKAHTPEWVKSELTHVYAAAARGQIEQTSALRAQSEHYDKRKKLVVIDLVKGSSFSFPPQLAQGMASALPSELAEIEITSQGSELHWPQLDADLNIEGLLAGLFGSRSLMRTHAAKAGRVKSSAKAHAAKVNLAKGGRPLKTISLHA
jgi:hypothetical protein